MIFLFLSALFGDALVNMVAEDKEASDVRVPVWERYTLPYETDGDFGVALEVGPYALSRQKMNGTRRIISWNTPCPLKRVGSAKWPHQLGRVVARCTGWDASPCDC